MPIPVLMSFTNYVAQHQAEHIVKATVYDRIQVGPSALQSHNTSHSQQIYYPEDWLPVGMLDIPTIALCIFKPGGYTQQQLVWAEIYKLYDLNTKVRESIYKFDMKTQLNGETYLNGWCYQCQRSLLTCGN